MSKRYVYIVTVGEEGSFIKQRSDNVRESYHGVPFAEIDEVFLSEEDAKICRRYILKYDPNLCVRVNRHIVTNSNDNHMSHMRHCLGLKPYKDLLNNLMYKLRTLRKYLLRQQGE